MWLGDQRGNLMDWSTQRWVVATGRRTDLQADPWLDGPVGFTRGMGRAFFDDWAAANDGVVERHQSGEGLLDSFAELSGPGFDAAAVDSAIAGFYERTADYDIDVWSEWRPVFRPFAYLVSVLFSRRLRQLNMPLSALDTSLGLTSQIVRVIGSDGSLLANAWVRTLVKTRRVVYVGSYSIAHPPGADGPCVKTVFPLPNGNAVVLLRPTLEADGSLKLVSAGERFGDPGFYFTVHRPNGTVFARYLRRFREAIHVYRTDAGELRTDHTMSLWRQECLHLHYRLRSTSTRSDP